MLFLKQLRLVNFCQYEDQTFTFIRKDGTPYPLVCFYGPNGIGKSNLLEAISMLTMNQSGRGELHIATSLKKYIRNPDYNPSYSSMEGFTYENGYISGLKDNKDRVCMVIEGTYEMDGTDYVVRLTDRGYTRNDFAPILNDPDAEIEEVFRYSNSGPWGSKHLQYRQRIAHFITSDSDLSLSKFQLHYSQMSDFEAIISEIMRYPADCIVDKGITTEDAGYCTDFCITKKDHRIHFKRMSAGEKKICKSFSQILNLMYDLSHPSPGEDEMKNWPRLILIDNVVMHVYYDRHVAMIECLKRIFNQQQIFATTHSGVLIPRAKRQQNDKDNELWVDLEPLNS